MFRINVKLFYLLSVWFAISNAYKFLVVFPFPGTSHTMLGNAFVKTLIEAGHEVTYISPIQLKNMPQNFRHVDVSKNFGAVDMGNILDIEKMMKKEIDLFDLTKAFEMMNIVANHTVMDDNVQRLIHDSKEQFDAVLVEWMYNELYAGFGAVFECPLIWFSSMDPHYLVLSLIDEDTNPTYSADVYTSESPPYNFLQRAHKLWSYFVTRYRKWLSNQVENEIYEKAFTSAMKMRGRTLPPYDEVKYSGSLMFGNSHVSAGQSIRLPQNYIPIGGYHVDPEGKSLPEDLQKLMDDSKQGVIYFSMGSMLKSKDMPEHIKHGILDVFAGLKQTVVWKFEQKLQGIPDNVHIVQWAPQLSILEHPNCVLFITHGGLLSMLETLHYGVPIVGIPMFADQLNNVNRASNKGFGRRVDLDTQFLHNFKAAVEDTVNNSRYRERARELSFVYHHRAASPRRELVHWVEHVVSTRGAPHLRSPALHLSFYQKLYLDLAAAMAAIVLVLWLVIRKACSTQKKATRKQKKH